MTTCRLTVWSRNDQWHGTLQILDLPIYQSRLLPHDPGCKSNFTVHSITTISSFSFEIYCTNPNQKYISRIKIKVVKQLSVNRLPVKLPITGFNFQLPITDSPTFFFTLCNFRLQLRLTHARRPTKTGLIGARHTVAVRRLGPVGLC